MEADDYDYVILEEEKICNGLLLVKTFIPIGIKYKKICTRFYFLPGLEERFLVPGVITEGYFAWSTAQRFDFVPGLNTHIKDACEAYSYSQLQKYI